MLQRTLGSGWGVLLPGVIIAGLAFVDLSLSTWKMIIVAGLLITSGMLWHKQLRHFILLPSCVALTGGMIALMLSLK